MAKRMSRNERTSTNTSDPNADRFQWDWVTFAVALLIAMLLALITFELWIPHPLQQR